jgi:hypothetical protein
MRVTVPLTSSKFLYCIVARLGPRNTPSVRPLAATDLHATPGAFPFPPGQSTAQRGLFIPVVTHS